MSHSARRFTIMGLIICLAAAFPVFFGPLEKECEWNRDCSEGYNCIERTCQKCLSCKTVGREGWACVTNFSDCGDCISGYEEILLTKSSKAIKRCVKRNRDIQKCANDHECPINQHCSESACVQCFDCSYLNRLPSPSGCSKEFNDCGGCMIGFVEAAVTFGTTSERCVPEEFTEHVGSPDSEQSTQNKAFTLWFYGSLIVCIIIVTFIIILRAIQKCYYKLSKEVAASTKELKDTDLLFKQSSMKDSELGFSQVDLGVLPSNFS